MSALLVVQARMTSTRLPGKVLLPILGRPMLSYQMERLERVASNPRLVVATTTNNTDDVIVRFCEQSGYDYVRGPEADVLCRYCAAIEKFGAHAVIRVTSDCPLLDPAVVDRVWEEFTNAGTRCDYASNMLRLTYPYGMAVEVVTASALLEAQQQARAPAEREHVTPYVYWRPERFALRSVELDRDLSFHRWTVDTPEDFELVSRILKALYPERPRFDMSDVLELLDRHPDWLEINRGVVQKSVTAN
jgi:spore coat polysaccharide biosynthesis protein SpsF